MRVCSVIVTYQDRFHMLKEVIDACFEEGVDKVVVIDNASLEHSKTKLKQCEKENNKLDVIYLEENKGSAGGYKRGLQKAYDENECEYIWLLDDDNKPLPGALERLKNFYSGIKEIRNKQESLALLANRIDKQIIEKKLYKAPLKNAFLGFDLFHRFIKKENDETQKIEVAPYGGLFFHKSLLKTVGYPREDFFVYVDDYEWSYKIPLICFVQDSCIKDMEKTNITLKSGVKHYLDKNEFVLYYGVRNRILWEKEVFVMNPILYKLNKIIYISILVGMNMFHPKLKIFLKAIKDAK